jgi:hypothetical protein
VKSIVNVESLSTFLEAVKSIRDEWFDDDQTLGPWFRGQQRAYWGLVPKLYREFGDYSTIDEDDVEREIREEFLIRAPILSETKPAGNDDWEWYFLMQHFGTPTRLLDWTEGALIALYFAVKDNQGFFDAAVWALDPFNLNKKTINIYEVIPPSAPRVSKRDVKRVMPWMPATFGRPTRLPRNPIAVYPTHIARRISTQRSCFTVHGTDKGALDRLELRPEGRLLKIVIPSFRVQSIQRELATSGVDEVTIFPDLDGLSRSLSAKYRSDTHSAPHQGVVTRLQPSKITKGGIGVFATRNIKKGTSLFPGENEEMLWVENEFSKSPMEIRKLYRDFAIFKKNRLGCPKSFNVLTTAWYLNEPKKGEPANVTCDPNSYDFSARRNIKEGEELTVDYSTYSEKPTL